MEFSVDYGGGGGRVRRGIVRPVVSQGILLTIS